MAELGAEEEKTGTEVVYLRKHGEAGRLQYQTFRKLGLPMGSGAIESSIRRVINLRLKNQGIAPLTSDPSSDALFAPRIAG